MNLHRTILRKDNDNDNMPSATPILSTSPGITNYLKRLSDEGRQPERNTRGLSPESERIINETPIPPSGTRRRPAKNSGILAPPVFEIDEYV